MRKPVFKRQDSNKKRLKPVWRRPKGIHSKLRRFQSKGRKPKIGYKKSAKQKEEQPILIKNINQLIDLDSSKKVIIASGVGLKKKIEILKKALDKGIEVLNHDLDTLQKRFEALKAENLKKKLLKEKSKAKAKAKEKKRLEEELEKKPEKAEKAKLEEEKIKKDKEEASETKKEEGQLKDTSKTARPEDKSDRKFEDRKLRDKIERDKILKKRI